MIVRYYLKFEPQPRAFLRLIGSSDISVEKAQEILDIALKNSDDDKGGYVEMSSWKIIDGRGTTYETGTLDDIYIGEGATRQKAVRRFQITESAANTIKTLILKEEKEWNQEHIMPFIEAIPMMKLCIGSILRKSKRTVNGDTIMTQVN